MKQETKDTSLEFQQNFDGLYADIRNILSVARQRAYSAVNFAMVESYWLIGQTIVEHEQHGEARADYGKGVLKELAAKLTAEFGKGLDERELRKMRQFYLMFKIRDTLRPELTWSHYRRLISVEDERARQWYMNEAADGVWSTRQMDRQISTLYYERQPSMAKSTLVNQKGLCFNENRWFIRVRKAISMLRVALKTKSRRAVSNSYNANTCSMVLP